MNKTELVDRLTERLGDRRVAEEALGGLIDIIERAMVRGDKVSITGFGVFEKHLRNPRTARNPRTGEAIKVKKTAVPRFRPGVDLKAVASGQKKKGREPRHVPLLPAGIASPRNLPKTFELVGAPLPAARRPVPARRQPAVDAAATSTPSPVQAKASGKAISKTAKTASTPDARDTATPSPSRRSRPAPSTSTRTDAAATPVDPTAATPAMIRAWATAAGVQVAATGRISPAVRQAYVVANTPPSTPTAAPAAPSTQRRNRPGSRGDGRTAPTPTKAATGQDGAPGRPAAPAPKRRDRPSSRTAPDGGAAPAAPVDPTAATPAMIRAWATAAGVHVAATGRISPAVRQAYVAATTPVTPAPAAKRSRRT